MDAWTGFQVPSYPLFSLCNLPSAIQVPVESDMDKIYDLPTLPATCAIQVPVGSDMDKIKASYKRLAIALHPDK